MAEVESTSLSAGSDTGRFSILLATLIGLLLVAPLSDAAAGRPLFAVAFSLILMSGVYAVSRRPRVFWVGLAIAVPALVTEWASHLTGARGLWVGNHLLTIAFIGYIVGAVFTSVLRSERVTIDTLFGGICVYLLLGAFFMEIFNLIEVLRPESFLRNGVALASPGHARLPGLIYFSFVTLTTLGYGDIVPTTDVARTCAVAEAIFGQLYVAIFVARLVGLHLAYSRSNSA